ncbi:hypothetical protein ABID21_000820 [Pseudorhizobium tarimense]|uniref:DUF4864 domain-containing protein n=1 Tax=Pseudorhizobium tarimense TaxID=1079109 RepID=A0ABV2H2J2_9HYPH|nr:DUF4864 domain-containing protein [Pseudorhizobium tarimense]MCJ8518277.1 DUF4864 domain-containing protein [Pseudorhizobium tarimense]
MFFRFACLLLSMLLFSGVSRAEDPVREAQAVIANQLSAFASDDAETAYSFASPNIRSIYRSETQFLDMVRKNYPPVYKLGNYAFGRSKLVGGGELVLQEVLISGEEGQDWTAVYEMRLMDDGSYKVNGVRMKRNTTSEGI